eukprot:6472929-Amphidinium_carterae.2
MVLALAMNKGRSSSYMLKKVTKFACAVGLATGHRLHVRWIPSESNVADFPSRHIKCPGSTSHHGKIPSAIEPEEDQAAGVHESFRDDFERLPPQGSQVLPRPILDFSPREDQDAGRNSHLGQEPLDDPLLPHALGQQGSQQPPLNFP